MSEVEFDRVMEAVRNAIVLVPDEEPLRSERQPKAANDNTGLAWPIIPFPEGWYVA